MLKLGERKFSEKRKVTIMIPAIFVTLKDSVFYTYREGRSAEVVGMNLATSQTELPSRRMQESFRWAVIPLGTNTKLREKYINFHNQVRFGRILEDLDSMAGNNAANIRLAIVIFFWNDSFEFRGIYMQWNWCNIPDPMR